MTGYHTRRVRPAAEADDPERIAIREARHRQGGLRSARCPIDDRRRTAVRAAMTADEIECIEEGGTEPTIACSGASLPPSTPTFASPPGHDLQASVGFEAHAA